MKTIQINHIGKTEGHLSFVGALIGNDFSQARIETEEGARLIEGILLNRKYYEVPIITARICGVCPIVHNLCSIKALEQAFGVKVTPEIVVLRKILLAAQWIHSHALHAFFLSFPDLIGISNNFDFVKKYPKECALALELRDWAIEICRVIGGRTVHPINSVVGGFNVAPDAEDWAALMKKNKDILDKAKTLFDFIAKQKLPKFARPTNFVTLKEKKEYAMYDGSAYFADERESVMADKLVYELEEIILTHEKVKRVKMRERVFVVSSLARINNNFNQLNKEAKKCWQKLKVTLPCYNSFYNIFAQAVEIVHCVEEITRLSFEVKSQKLKVKSCLKVDFKVRAGKGVAVLEAPRGLLYHKYETDYEGNIVNSNIITPTAIFLANMEQDLEQYLLEIQNLPDKQRDHLIKTLIRAYDPCISCATH
jgi:coenzyme F420-reducing hydrogenase alpha subunit